MIPKFAVVGRSNKGKSSIVATLTEDDRIAVAATPGTTRQSRAHTFQIDGRELFTIYDTPGFEDAPAALEWLKAKPVHAHERRARIEEFYREFAKTESFRFECELLKPILDGAAILYVTDTSHPYRPNFEAEFEILQWTGQPSMALLNQIGEGDFKDEWTRALGQYFRKVKTFNAHTSWVSERVALVQELAFLSDEMAAPLREAAQQILRLQERRFSDAAHVISDVIAESLKFEIKLDSSSTQSDDQLRSAFFDGLRTIEKKGRERLLQQFGFHNVQGGAELTEYSELTADLFSTEQWEILGLTRTELVTAGTMAGALAGGTIDAMVGGASFLIGTGLGSIAGAASSAYLAFSEPNVAGINLTKKVKIVGPNTNPNFPWVLLDRQMDYVRALARRTHAMRGELDWKTQGKGFASTLKKMQIAQVTFHFQMIRSGLGVQSAKDSIAAFLAEFWKSNATSES